MKQKTKQKTAQAGNKWLNILPQILTSKESHYHLVLSNMVVRTDASGERGEVLMVHDMSYDHLTPV